MSPPLNLDQLLASFPDNIEGQIVPENLRDYVESVELKYNNWVVVKTGQPNGNAFPQPDVDGKRYLQDHTVYVTNGDITLTEPLVLGTEVQITSLGGSVFNSITLDASSAFDALLEDDITLTNGSLFTISNITLVAQASKKIFKVLNLGICKISDCGYQANFVGDITANVSGASFLMENIGFTFTQDALKLHGDFSQTLFFGCSFGGGFFGNSGDGFDFSGVTSLDYIDIVSCSVSSDNATKFFFKAVPAPNIEGRVLNSRRTATALGDLIEGVTPVTPDWLFVGNTLNIGNSPTASSFGQLLGSPSDNAALQAEFDLKLDLSQKGIANGVAELDGSGKVPLSQIPNEVQGGVTVIGFWDADTNTPDLSALTLDQGQAYQVSVSGSTNLNGETNWAAKDLAVWSDDLAGNWFKLDNTDDVLEVNGKKGVVVLDKTDIGLDQVDNTSDVNKPISNATATALGGKVDSVNSGQFISVDNTDPNNPVVNFDFTPYAFIQNQTGLVSLSSTFFDFLSLNFNAPVAGNYEIRIDFVWSYNTSTSDFLSRVRLDGATINGLEQREEPQDSGGTGVVLDRVDAAGTANTGTDQRITGCYSIVLESLAAGAHTVALQFASANNVSAAAIYAGKISAELKGV